MNLLIPTAYASSCYVKIATQTKLIVLVSTLIFFIVMLRLVFKKIKNKTLRFIAIIVLLIITIIFSSVLLNFLHDGSCGGFYDIDGSYKL